MVRDCNCAVTGVHGVEQEVNLTGILQMPLDGHNHQSLLNMNQRWEWKHLYYKCLISANAQVHTVNVNTLFRYHIEDRSPFIIDNEYLVLKCNGLL